MKKSYLLLLIGYFKTLFLIISNVFFQLSLSDA